MGPGHRAFTRTPGRANCAPSSRLNRLVVPAGLDEFFEELGVPGTDVSDPPPFGPAEVEKLLATAPKYGLEVPPPP